MGDEPRVRLGSELDMVLVSVMGMGLDSDCGCGGGISSGFEGYLRVGDRHDRSRLGVEGMGDAGSAMRRGEGKRRGLRLRSAIVGSSGMMLR